MECGCSCCPASCSSFFSFTAFLFCSSILINTPVTFTADTYPLTFPYFLVRSGRTVALWANQHYLTGWHSRRLLNSTGLLLLDPTWPAPPVMLGNQVSSL